MDLGAENAAMFRCGSFEITMFLASVMAEGLVENQIGTFSKRKKSAQVS